MIPDDVAARNLRAIAQDLADFRESGDLHPRYDGKLAEAEINLRGVAGTVEARADMDDEDDDGIDPSLVTDGGRESGPPYERRRQTDALEALVEERRLANALLAQISLSLERRLMVDMEGGEPGDARPDLHASAVDDRLVELVDRFGRRGVLDDYVPPQGGGSA